MTKLSNYAKRNINSKAIIDNPIITNPLNLIDKSIVNVGEQLIDFLPKIENHFSKRSAFKIKNSIYRIFEIGIDEQNKIYSISLLINDKSDNDLINIKQFIRDEYNKVKVTSSKNILDIVWENSTVDLLKLSEIIIYLGNYELCTKETINE